jgi:hypothetical protein
MSRTDRQTPLGSLWHLVLSNLRYLSGDPWFTLSCDTKGFDIEMLIDGLDSIVEQYRHEARIAVAVINHPKLMLAPQIELFRAFIERSRNRYQAQIDFATTTEVLNAVAGPSAALQRA